MLTWRRFKLLFGLIAATATLSLRPDTHIYVGAAGTNQNDKLYFSNGVLFDAALTNYVMPQILRTNGFNAGHYRGDVLTFAGLPATVPNGGPVPGHAAPGARLAVEVVSVEGPPGASFEFWEGDGESDLGVITFSIPVGQANASSPVVISENSDQPGSDPYGHVHGRQFTTSRPGLYLVGFRAIDLSTHGTGGGPIHTPSDILKIRFQAGLRIESISSVTNRTTVSFRSPPGITNQLQTAISLTGSWKPVAVARGNSLLQSITDTNASAAHRFYRVEQLNNLP